MCGITGVINSNQSQEEVERFILSMTDALGHRGPDDRGVFSDRRVCFGHVRLAIIDPQHAIQPMMTSCGRYVLTYNGEIYNYKELREKLIAKGVVFRTESDTEVLLQMLAAFGVDALADLNGMFAFAFLDRETGKWILGRDHFGIKPLYYVAMDKEIAFASEIKALLRHPDVSASSNWKAMQQYLTFQFCLHGETLYEGIKSLMPGHYLCGGIDGGYEEKCYWDTNYQIDDSINEEQYIEQLAWLLEDSVRLQLRSDVPLGAHVSGGIDSGVVASLAAKKLDCALPVFHGRFAESELYDESRYAKDVCKFISGQYHEVVPSASEFIKILPDLIYALDEPVAGPGVFPQYMVSRLAADNVKVVLGGQGGDEIFGGYARYLVGYLEQALKGAIFETQEEGSHIVSLESIVPNLPVLQQYHPMMQSFWKKGLFEGMDARYFRLINRSPHVNGVLSDDANARYNEEEVYADFQKLFNHPETSSYINKMTHFDQKALLPALLQVEDRVSMSVSIESRVPLLDRRIVDLVTSMPPATKFKGGATKHILKAAAGDLLPSRVLTRKDKMGFPVPFAEWMQGGEVRDFVCDTLSSSACRGRSLWDHKAIAKVVNGKKAYGRELWGILCLELWHGIFMDRSGEL